MLWRVFGRGQAASAGRVQSVAVRMVVERERARMRFRSGQWSDLEGTFVAENAAVPRLARRARRQARRRRPRLRSPRPARSPRRACERRRAARRAERRRPRRPPARRRVPGHEHRVRSVHREAARAVHHVDAAAGVGPQAALHRVPHDGRRATPLRAGFITYMRTDSTNLSEQAVGAARTAIREQYGEEYLPGRAAHVPQQGEERAGGARGDPARRRSHPHARRGERRARRRRAPALRADLDPHRRVPDVRRTRPQDDDPPRCDVDAGRAGDVPRVGQGVRLPRLAPRVHRRRRRGRRGRVRSACCPRSSKARP